ncbi:MAG: bifunctional oligoribonuclease/PAP phosphatase NrnA [Anaerolineae bacterium]|nr:MAG: bifunctional oligoribonuclease/PAP phosphatase NrnA [Anaerolineae bacterium]
MWSKVADLIHQHDNFVLTTHVHPDGDGLGSELALAALLKQLGKDVAVVNADSMPEMLEFLDPHGCVRVFHPDRDQATLAETEVIFILDSSVGWARLGKVGEVAQASPATTVCIDHHPDDGDFVDLACVDSDAGATGELIFELIEHLGGELTHDMAQALYVAIVTDTGSFRFGKTSSRTHRIAARLLEAGVMPHEIYSHLYEQRPLGHLHLQSQLLAQLTLAYGGRLAWSKVTRETLQRYGVARRDITHLVDLGLSVAGVEVSALFSETRNDRVQLNLRSKGRLAVNEVAQRLGGGGHPFAAGAQVDGPLDQAIERVLEEMQQVWSRDGLLT